MYVRRLLSRNLFCRVTRIGLGGSRKIPLRQEVGRVPRISQNPALRHTLGQTQSLDQKLYCRCQKQTLLEALNEPEGAASKRRESNPRCRVQSPPGGATRQLAL